MAKHRIRVKLNGHKLSISNMRPKAFHRRGDEVVWICDDAPLKIDFDYPGKPSPFGWSSKRIAKGVEDGGAVNPPARRVPYKLTIDHPDYEVVIDPEVDVDGGDPGGGRRAKKKASKKSARKKK
jgi:hypothetical protein